MIATDEVVTLDERPLSTLLRETTRTRHERAESRGFVTALLAGDLSRGAYADLAVQHLAIYTALEAVGEAMARDAVGRHLVFPEIARVTALRSDLRHVGEAASVGVLPATTRYVARLESHAAAWVGAYLAHAYTRYLGDFSGGLIVRRMIQRHYGVADHEVAFYDFPGIRPKPFKDRYRAAMDAAPFDDAERARIGAEARLAFDLNADVFDELGAVHLR